MNATPYIEALSKETGMDITLSASGAAALSLGGRNLLIQWIEATHSFIVYVEVGALGGWRNGEICRLLLASNFLLADTQGGAEGKPRSRLSPPGNSSASRAFQKYPNAGISGAPQYDVHSAENGIDAGKP